MKETSRRSKGERGYTPSRLSLLGMRGRLSAESPSGRDTGDPTERGAYHDILLCFQTEKCLLRMRDGVCSDVSGAAFNCGVPGEREREAIANPGQEELLQLLLLLAVFVLAIVLQINIIL